MAKILLIEDDEAFRDFLSAELQRIGHAVTVASSGQYVVHGIGKTDFGVVFDVIITDIVMPDVDGLEVIHLLRAASPACRIVAISGGSRYDHSNLYLALAEAFGAKVTLAKPFSVAELSDVIDGVILAA